MSRINKPIFRFLIDPSFLGVNRLFVLSFENETTYLPTREIKNYNVMVDGQKFFDQPIRNNLTTQIILVKFQQVKVMIIQLIVCQTIITKNYNKMIAIDLRKHRALDANPKARQQINFTRNLE